MTNILYQTQLHFKQYNGWLYLEHRDIDSTFPAVVKVEVNCRKRGTSSFMSVTVTTSLALEGRWGATASGESEATNVSSQLDVERIVRPDQVDAEMGRT